MLLAAWCRVQGEMWHWYLFLCCSCWTQHHWLKRALCRVFLFITNIIGILNRWSIMKRAADGAEFTVRKMFFFIQVWENFHVNIYMHILLSIYHSYRKRTKHRRKEAVLFCHIWERVCIRKLFYMVILLFVIFPPSPHSGSRDGSLSTKYLCVPLPLTILERYILSYLNLHSWRCLFRSIEIFLCITTFIFTFIFFLFMPSIAYLPISYLV